MSNSPHLDWASSLGLGLSGASAANIVARRELLRLEGATELLTLKHLSVRAGVPWESLRNVIERKRFPYREIHIPKRTGGFRVIHAPTEQLKQTQRWILDNVLSALGPRHPNSYAYDSNVSTIDCARRHIGAQWLIKTDLHDFFPTVTERDAYRIFKRLNYSSLLSFELARICTWPRRLRPSTREHHSFRDDQGLPYPTWRQGRLPQGAPTSGALANEAMRQVDEKLTSFALSNGLVYTRYSDDMVFSGHGDFRREAASNQLREIGKIVTGNGFQLHQKKSQLVPPGARKLVLGTMILDDRIAILPEQRRMLGLYLHAVRKYGLLDFVIHRGFKSPIAFINHVYGWLAYLSQIDSIWVDTQKGEWESVLLANGIDLNALTD